jgi:phosphoribosylformylglycinamidine cyclo-ligase
MLGEIGLSRKITYAEAGVDRKLRAKSKKELQVLKNTYKFSRFGKIVKLPYGNIFPFGKNRCLDFQIEGVGTKVLLAQLAQKYDTIGIDGVAMVVNDVIRSGARPFALVDNIHAQVSDPNLVKEWLKGIAKGAEESECVVPGGEIGDVAELIKGLVEGKGFDMIVAAVGEVDSEKVISGRNIEAGDAIVGLRSSGIHSNGITLARKVLFKQWGGKYEPHDIPETLQKEVIFEALEPTRIYVKSFLKATEKFEVKAAVHVTGDAYLKFERLTRFSKGIGFEFDNFKPQPIFELIQRTAADLGGAVTDEEMFKTFNMGWGFAIIVNKANVDNVIEALEKSGTHAEQIGRITRTEGIRILKKNKKLILT